MAMLAQPNMFQCTCCLLTPTDADIEDPKDDFVICIYPDCHLEFEVQCRNCTRFCHRRVKTHKYSDDAEHIKYARNWLQLSKTYQLQIIRSLLPTDSKSTANAIKCGVGSGANALYAVGKVSQNAMKHVGVNASITQGITQCKNITPSLVPKGSIYQTVPIPVDISKSMECALQTLGKSSRESKQIIAKITSEGGEEAVELALKNYNKAASKATVSTLKNMAKGQAIVCVLFWIVELGWNAKLRYYDQCISDDEFSRLNSKATVANTSGCIGGIVGGCLGVFAGPVGIAIGSAFGGIVCDFFARKQFDKLVPNEEQKKIQQALNVFNYKTQGTIKGELDSNDFNAKELRRRYHKYSKYHSPDTSSSKLTDKQKKERWHLFYGKYCLLLALCRQKKKKRRTKLIK
eukprot:25329_1